jgi:serine/threonine protein phosphatase PrpC
VDRSRVAAIVLFEDHSYLICLSCAGEVSVSRSIGDYPYKGFVPGEVVTDFFSWPENHDMIFNADLVISDPESKHVDIDELCEFVIIASDGLWDVVSNEKAVSRVR